MSYGLDEHTLSLLHFDNSLKDECGIGWNSAPALSFSKDKFKFGTRSLYGAISTDFSNTAVSEHNQNLILSANDFTIDWWEYKLDIQLDTRSLWYSTPMGMEIGYAYDKTQVYLDVTSNGSTWNLVHKSKFGNILLNQWVHRALVRSGSNLICFENGNVIGTYNIGANPINSTNPFFGIKLFTGYMDEFRVSNIARWTTSFTPPTFPYVKFNAEVMKDNANLLHGYK